ncbi:hypothetical protein Q7P37_001643 [Cladosporium fusiforme]
MSIPLSYAQVCAKANGDEIFQFDGLNMSKGLAIALRARKADYAVHRQQLSATQKFIADRGSKQAATKAIKPKDIFPIMALPWDVRHTILEHMVEAQTIRTFLRNASTAIKLPEVARAGSSKLRRECLLVTLKKCTIEIHSGPGNAAFQAWLAEVDFNGIETNNCRNGFDAIHALSFPYFSRFPYDRPGITVNNYVKLALACRNLRTLTLNFHSQEISRFETDFWDQEEDVDEDHGVVYAQAAASMREKYHLDRLLGAKALQTLCFVAAKTATMEVLAAWFESQFKGRKPAVVVEFV